MLEGGIGMAFLCYPDEVYEKLMNERTDYSTLSQTTRLFVTCLVKRDIKNAKILYKNGKVQFDQNNKFTFINVIACCIILSKKNKKFGLEFFQKQFKDIYIERYLEACQYINDERYLDLIVPHIKKPYFTMVYSCNVITLKYLLDNRFLQNNDEESIAIFYSLLAFDNTDKADYVDQYYYLKTFFKIDLKPESISQKVGLFVDNYFPLTPPASRFVNPFFRNYLHNTFEQVNLITQVLPLCFLHIKKMLNKDIAQLICDIVWKCRRQQINM